LIGLVPVLGWASGPADAAAAAAAAASAPAAQDTIPAGTIITMQNWQQFKQFMPDGMVDLFAGKYFWKMPNDVAMEVGPTVIHPLPATFVAATEKYASQVKIVPTSDGGLNLVGYTGGLPFPDPQEPNRGWKILANFWFRYFPHITVNTPDSKGFQCTEDSNGAVACAKQDTVYRQLSFNTDPGTPQTFPGGEGKFWTFWAMIEQPEQLKYTATLTIAFTDMTKPERDYIFNPAVRRAEPRAIAARCATSGGSDITPDDRRLGFNGNPPLFDVQLLREGKILSLMDIGLNATNFPQDFEMPLGWPKQSWGKWELRDVYVIDVRRIKSMTENYCYGKRIMYIDKQFFGPLWEDLSDARMKPWKIGFIQPIVLKVAGVGLQNSTGAGLGHFWDIQNNHASFGGPSDGHGYLLLTNDDVPEMYKDITRYTTQEGLYQVMR
jgi:hypothetical protein